MPHNMPPLRSFNLMPTNFFLKIVTIITKANVKRIAIKLRGVSAPNAILFAVKVDPHMIATTKRPIIDADLVVLFFLLPQNHFQFSSKYFCSLDKPSFNTSVLFAYPTLR